MTDYAHIKSVTAPFRRALYTCEEAEVRTALKRAFHPDAPIRLPYPLGEQVGPDGIWEHALGPLFQAIPDVERRDYILIAGPDEHGADWVGAGGYYTGLFAAPFLGIPPTGHQAHLRFHEFYRIEGAQVVEVQALWDIPELMVQAGAWPLSPSLGREWNVPGPATQDGVRDGPRDAETGDRAAARVVDMLDHMKRHPSQGGPEVMEMERFWHPRMSWYGPTGIGTGRGIRGFREVHQIPFLAAMPDRGTYLDEITYHFFGDGPYVAVTGWPNMIQTLTHDGWLGLAPTGTRITMKSLDFWRLEGDLIRENWVLVDLLDVYAQLGIDVFARMKALTAKRSAL